MKKIIFHYPGDPPEEAQVLTGKEFREDIRGGGPGEIKISSWGLPGELTPEPTVIQFDEVICDTCNAEIGEEDECVLTAHSLYCPECTAKYINPYVKE